MNPISFPKSSSQNSEFPLSSARHIGKQESPRFSPYGRKPGIGVGSKLSCTKINITSPEPPIARPNLETAQHLNEKIKSTQLSLAQQHAELISRWSEDIDIINEGTSPNLNRLAIWSSHFNPGTYTLHIPGEGKVQAQSLERIEEILAYREVVRNGGLLIEQCCNLKILPQRPPGDFKCWAIWPSASRRGWYGIHSPGKSKPDLVPSVTAAHAFLKQNVPVSEKGSHDTCNAFKQLTLDECHTTPVAPRDLHTEQQLWAKVKSAQLCLAQKHAKLIVRWPEGIDIINEGTPPDPNRLAIWSSHLNPGAYVIHFPREGNVHAQSLSHIEEMLSYRELVQNCELLSEQCCSLQLMRQRPPGDASYWAIWPSASSPGEYGIHSPGKCKPDLVPSITAAYAFLEKNVPASVKKSDYACNVFMQMPFDAHHDPAVTEGVIHACTTPSVD